MKIWAYYGESNEMNGKPFDSLNKAIRFLKKKRAKERYVEMHAFEHAGKVGLSATVRIDV